MGLSQKHEFTGSTLSTCIEMPAQPAAFSVVAAWTSCERNGSSGSSVTFRGFLPDFKCCVGQFSGGRVLLPDLVIPLDGAPKKKKQLGQV